MFWPCRIRRGVLVATVAALLAAPMSCSSSDPDPSGNGEASGQGSVRIVIDGRSRTVSGKVVCLDGPTGEVNIEVDPLDADPGAGPAVPIVVLDLTPRGDAPSVSLLTINLPDIGLATGRYRNRGAPTASKAGSTYTVKGEGSVLGTPPKSQIYMPFELELTCPAAPE